MLTLLSLAAPAQAGALTCDAALANIFWLGIKELRSFAARPGAARPGRLCLLASPSTPRRKATAQELHNASIAIVDEDHSPLSRRIAQAFLPPYFKPPQAIAERDIDRLMDSGAIHLRRRHPAELPARRPRRPPARGAAQRRRDRDDPGGHRRRLHRSRSSRPRSQRFVSRVRAARRPPVAADVRIAFNPNVTTAWFTSVMGIINNITMLAIILAGAAVIREREHGTLDHLLVMPLTPFEIAMAKVWANGLVITVAVGLSLYFVVRDAARHADRRLGPAVPRRASCSICSSLRRSASFSATVARSMPQLGLLFILVVTADEHAVRRQHAAREHAALAADRDAGVAVDALRVVCRRRSSIVAPASTSSGRSSSRLR